MLVLGSADHTVNINEIVRETLSTYEHLHHPVGYVFDEDVQKRNILQFPGKQQG